MWNEKRQNRKGGKTDLDKRSELQHDNEDSPPWSILTPMHQGPKGSNCRACTSGKGQDTSIIENGRSQCDPNDKYADVETDSTHATSGNEWCSGQSTASDSDDRHGTTGDRPFFGKRSNQF